MTKKGDAGRGVVDQQPSGHPGFRSFLVVLVLSGLTLGVFWFYYLRRMFLAADRRRGVPFFHKTYWTMVGLLALTVAAVLLVGLPSPGGDAGPFASYQQDGGEAVSPPIRVGDPPATSTPVWQTNGAEILLVAYATVMAAFLFLEIGRFRPAIASPVALPALTLAYLPFLFIPGVGWGALLVAILTLIAMHDLHRGLMAFFDGKTLDGGPYEDVTAAEPAADPV